MTRIVSSVRAALAILISTVFVIATAASPAAAYVEPPLTAPVSDIVITADEPAFLKINLPSLEGCPGGPRFGPPRSSYGGPYVNFQLGGSGSSVADGDAYFEATESGEWYIEFVVQPRSNGTTTFEVDTLDCASPVTITVTVAVPAWDEFTTSMSLNCGSAAPGTRARCTAYINNDGPGTRLAPPRRIQILQKVEGRWKEVGAQTLGAGENDEVWENGKQRWGWDFGSPKVTTSPLRLRATSPGLPAATAVVVPFAPVSVRAPGAAIVGDPFTVTVRVDRRFKGTCSVGRTTAKVRNGVATFRIYSVQPGPLTVTAVCSARGWARSEGKHTMWIRG